LVGLDFLDDDDEEEEIQVWQKLESVAFSSEALLLKLCMDRLARAGEVSGKERVEGEREREKKKKKKKR
jgi:hypothetical protein